MPGIRRKDRTMENLFNRIGISDAMVKSKIDESFQTLFFDEDEKIYLEVGEHMACMVDTGNNDARTEGMSYGMMMAVQMDRKDIFDKLWLFSKTFMHHEDGKYQGYFAWSVQLDGTRNAQGPAPDGEEYYALALFFAAHRWGDGETPFDYSVQARNILKHCLHQQELQPDGSPMWDKENCLIKFVPETPFSDPSYHLPHFYELFAKWADEEDRDFWAKAAKASREYVPQSAHPITGMCPEYAEFDGSMRLMFGKVFEYYSDAYRVAMNIGLDSAWFGKNQKLSKVADDLQIFFAEKADLNDLRAYHLNGIPFEEEAMHPTAIIATNAAASLATDGKYSDYWLKIFWETPLRKGQRRYYDNCLYFFCLLMLAGEYRIY